MVNIIYIDKKSLIFLGTYLNPILYVVSMGDLMILLKHTRSKLTHLVLSQ